MAIPASRLNDQAGVFLLNTTFPIELYYTQGKNSYKSVTIKADRPFYHHFQTYLYHINRSINVPKLFSSIFIGLCV